MDTLKNRVARLERGKPRSLREELAQELTGLAGLETGAAICRFCKRHSLAVMDCWPWLSRVQQGCLWAFLRLARAHFQPQPRHPEASLTPHGSKPH